MSPIKYEEADCRPAVVSVNGIDYKGEATEYRVSTHPYKFKYEIRHSDYDDSIPCILEPGVWVNFYGTFLTDFEIPLSEEGYAVIDEESDGYIAFGYTD